MNMPQVSPGVANPYVTHAHPYPTRYHGSIYTRPVFGMPYVLRPQGVFRPANFNANWPAGPATPSLPTSGLGDPNIDTGCGCFRRPRSGGGGIFNSALSGGLGQSSDTTRLLAFFGAAALVGVGTFYGLRWYRKGKP
jgi:hypothetical protein